ncbi:hypothetical protein VFPFJ_11020 [Purpureocillium lilacinum]|uniref:Uncharacterized protein n=1 Tax=Purpureocillium lilacinum TaxID=33203 RepID=A0A179GFP2_PURLI|nr:hypothetical protein VFPFJ_11020 [Purpureocillium lilacinum]OAQ71479.1 hypothetical protein VFPFJ_11020 [Purpureocillium lilacinum]OAQ76667.1 hypothetical protein VFPBJ_09027 [Purpureocillium lilacinum]
MHRFGSGTFVATGWERSGQERAPRGRRGPAPPTPFGPPSTRSRPITLCRVAWLHVQGGLDAGRGTNSTQTPPAFSGVANHALIWGTLPWSSSLYVDLTLDARRKRKLPVYRGLALYLVEVNVADVSDDSSVHKDCWGFERLRTISSKLGVTCREVRLVAGRLHPSGDAACKGHCYSTQVKNRPPLERKNYMSPDHGTGALESNGTQAPSLSRFPPQYPGLTARATTCNVAHPPSWRAKLCSPGGPGPVSQVQCVLRDRQPMRGLPPFSHVPRTISWAVMLTITSG